MDSALVLIAFATILAVLLMREIDHARERDAARRERERIITAAAAERAQLLDRIMARDYQQYVQAQVAHVVPPMPPYTLTDEQEAELEEHRARIAEIMARNGHAEV